MASESFKEKLRTKEHLEHYRKEMENPKFQPDKISKYFLKKIGINDLELSIGHFQVQQIDAGQTYAIGAEVSKENSVVSISIMVKEHDI